MLAEDCLVIPALPCTTAPNRLTFEKSQILLAVSCCIVVMFGIFTAYYQIVFTSTQLGRDIPENV